MINPSPEYLHRKLPIGSADYCLRLWEENPFRFVVSKKRVSKNGDYRYDRLKKSHTITVNENLNPFAFLITYIHEVAHRTSFEKYGRKIRPHGKEWKDEFRRLMDPLLDCRVFPSTIQDLLSKHMSNPKASTSSDQRLSKALSMYDVEDGTLHLDEIADGEEFIFRNKKYVRIKKRRTRIVCEEISSRRCYLISGSADVEKKVKDP